MLGIAAALTYGKSMGFLEPQQDARLGKGKDKYVVTTVIDNREMDCCVMAPS